MHSERRQLCSPINSERGTETAWFCCNPATANGVGSAVQVAVPDEAAAANAQVCWVKLSSEAQYSDSSSSAAHFNKPASVVVARAAPAGSLFKIVP